MDDGWDQIDIAGVTFTNYGPEMKLKKLPRTRQSYLGRDPGAAWRESAIQRIESVPKGDMTIRVTDGSGRVLPNARVRVRMTEYAFAFGSAVVARDIVSDDPAMDPYRARIEELFNEVTFENDLKWVSYGFGDANDIEAALAWLDRDVMTVLFSHPSVNGVILWGFWDQRHWKPHASLYDKDWNLRSHGKAWKDLVKDQWWTDEVVTVDEAGHASLRGFRGSYQITVESGHGTFVIEAVNDCLRERHRSGMHRSHLKIKQPAGPDN